MAMILGTPVQLEMEEEATEKGDAGSFRIPFVWDPLDGCPSRSGIDTSSCVEVPECLKRHGLELEAWSSHLKRLQWALEPVQPFLNTRWLSEEAQRAAARGEPGTVLYEVFLAPIPCICRFPFVIIFMYLSMILTVVYLFLRCLCNIIDCCAGRVISRSISRCQHARKVNRLQTASDRLRQWQADFNQVLEPLHLFCKTHSSTTVALEEDLLAGVMLRVVTAQRLISFAYTSEAIEQLKEQPHTQWSIDASVKSEDQDLMRGLDLVLDLLSKEGKHTHV